MPSSFTRVLPNAFGCSPSTPVSDCGTGRGFVHGGLFVAEMRRTSGSNAVALAGRGRLSPRSVVSRRPPRFDLRRGWRNINRLSIGYALGPRLRSRLTLGGLTFPRKPCAFGGRASHPSCRYSFRHTHSIPLHGSLPVPLRCGYRRSPTIFGNAECGIRIAASKTDLPCRISNPPFRIPEIRDCGATLSPRHFRRGMARPVSCYALLKWWLLLSQHPGCHRDPTSFATERRLGALVGGLGSFPLEREASPPRSDCRGPPPRYSELGFGG